MFTQSDFSDKRITARELIARCEAEYQAAGYCVRAPSDRALAKRLGHSWTSPVRKVIWISAERAADEETYALTLAHECIHIRQQKGTLTERIKWAWHYLTNPTFRWRAEVEAEGHETYWRALLTGRCFVHAPLLWGKQRPYRTHRGREETEQAILAVAAALQELRECDDDN